MSDFMWQSNKRFAGFSTCFRQWRADMSHCRFLHGYALAFDVTFEGRLDYKNWVMDFGGAGELKKQLADFFDHTTIVAEDDPALNAFMKLDKEGIIQLRTMPHVGCEMFARHVLKMVNNFVAAETKGRVYVTRVTCIETENNSATYRRRTE